MGKYPDVGSQGSYWRQDIQIKNGGKQEKAYEDELEVSMWTNDFLKKVSVCVYACICEYVYICIHIGICV